MKKKSKEYEVKHEILRLFKKCKNTKELHETLDLICLKWTKIRLTNY